jgi:carbonic anhydrase
MAVRLGCCFGVSHPEAFTAATSYPEQTMDTVLEQLKSGVRHFRSDVYAQQPEIFAQAVNEPQRPHTLFITCADSRIDPNALTATGPGEVFVTRNIGNMVPPYGEMLGGVSAVIEYAVAALGVRHVVLCGHSDCGAMKALLDPSSTAKMPSVRNWLKNAHTALAVAQTLHENDIANHAERPLLDVLTEQNVLLQLQHLRTHPAVATAITTGDLTLSGWIYSIGTGHVSIAESNSLKFTPVD